MDNCGILLKKEGLSPEKRKYTEVKTAKLVTGILCMAFTIMVLFQSCAAGVFNTLSENGETSGSAGVMLALLMLAGGIVEVATRKSEKKGGAVAALILFLLAALFGFTNAGLYADLNIWAAWCLILGVLNLISIFAMKKDKGETGGRA